MADNSLLEKVLGLQEKYEALQNQLADPEVISDMKKFVQLNKEYKELTPIIEAGNEFKKILENYETLRTARTLSLRSVAVQVETRRLSLPATSSVCTLSSSRPEAGEWRSQARPRVQRAVSRKSCARYRATACMVS